MPGPPPKPTELKRMNGNPGRKPLNESEPKPTPASQVKLVVPAWLPQEGKKEFRRLVKACAAQPWITEVDRNVLAAYCFAWSEFVELAKNVIQNGHSDVLGKRRPESISLFSSMDKLMHLGASLGFSPAERSRIILPKVNTDSEFETFLKGGAKKLQRVAEIEYEDEPLLLLTDATGT